MKTLPIHRYEDIDYSMPVSSDMYDKVDKDMARVRMFSQENAYNLLNREIDRLHFRFKALGRTELEEEIVARTIALKEML